MHITKLRPINCVILSCQSHFVSCTVYSQQKSYKTTEIRRGQTTVSDFDLSDSRKPTMASDSWSGETRAHSIPLSHPNDNDFLWAQHSTGHFLASVFKKQIDTLQLYWMIDSFKSFLLATNEPYFVCYLFIRQTNCVKKLDWFLHFSFDHYSAAFISCCQVHCNYDQISDLENTNWAIFSHGFSFVFLISFSV